MTLSVFLIFVGSLLLLALVLILLIRFTLLVVTVEQTSMLPTLAPDDRVLVLRYWPGSWLRKGQIVLVQPDFSRKDGKKSSNNVLYIKKIVGKAGERLITTSHDETPVSGTEQQVLSGQQEQKMWYIPAKYIFVRGDNRTESTDSHTWGPVPFRCIRGVMLMRLPRKAIPVSPIQRLPLEIPQQQGPSVGEQAPSFLVGTLSGETVTLHTYSGHPTLLLFFFPLRSHSMPHQEMLSESAIQATRLLKIGGKVVLVSGATAERTHAYVQDLKIDLPVLIAPRETNAMFKDYLIFGTPFYCFIDAQGIVQSTGYVNEVSSAWKTLVDAWSEQASSRL